MSKKEKITLAVCFLVCFLCLGYTFVFADDDGYYDDVSTDYSDSFTDNVENDLLEIKMLLSDVINSSDESIEVEKANGEILKEISEKEVNVLDVENNRNLSMDASTGNEVDQSDQVSEEASEEVNGSEDQNTSIQEPEEESTENNSELVNDPVDLEDVHSDLQKILISLWSLAGLYLGTKVISRMFGNG